MAMTLAEMDLETAEYVPAREVMCTVWYQPPCRTQSWHQSGTVHQNSSGVYYAQGGDGISILSGNNVLDGNNTSILGL